MFTIPSYNHFKIPAFITFLLFIVFVGSMGVGFMVASHHHHGSGCPFMLDVDAVCNMDIIDHVFAWQHMFVAINTDSYMMFIVFVVLVFLRLALYPELFQGRYIYRRDRDIEHNIHNLFLLLFSNGILNSTAH